MYPILLLIVLIPLVLMILDRTVLPMKWTCHIFGWHNGRGSEPGYHPNDILKINLKSRCSKCGKEVIQDSQGNWF